MTYKQRVLSAAILLVANTSALAAECIGVGQAENAVNVWETANKVSLSVEARGHLLSNFCDSVNALINLQHEPPISSTRIEGVAQQAVTDYLDRVGRTDVQPRSLAATLGEKLGYSGLSRQVINPYGRLSITYPHRVDYLLINGERHSPYAEFLLLAGQATIDGVAASKKVCTFSITIEPSKVSAVSC